MSRQLELAQRVRCRLECDGWKRLPAGDDLTHSHRDRQTLDDLEGNE